ncbi:MAG TPA: glucose-6-phosphate dehydrogenase [Alphaproteobacteria bacterium]|nr:glucose-6-phosphate dehydrogenase [Alphaproteobacteria bacterium]
MDDSADRLKFDPVRADPAPPCVLVIFGAGGDLTRRLLVPALYNLACAGLLNQRFAVIGVDHNQRTDEAFRQYETEQLTNFATQKDSEFEASGFDEQAWNRVRERLFYLTGDFEDKSTFTKLAKRLEEVSRAVDAGGSAIFYLATSARFFAGIVEALAAAGLTKQEGGCFRRVVVEKPFGNDLPSAKALNKRLLAVLDEGQIFRIDHFLGKETVQNMIVLRFANGIFEPIWNRNHIDHIQITAAETVTVEDRGSFYDATGALRDMVPNHMFQLLTMTAMEAPNSFDAEAFRNEKSKLLEAVHRFSPDEALRNAVRGQYRAGKIGDRAVTDYRAEPHVDPRSETETYIAMKLGIDNWRWAGVPFYLRTGKALATRRTEIVVQFKQAPYALFRDTPVESLARNYFVICIQPDEGVVLQFDAKIPGPIVRLAPVRMEFRYKDYFKSVPNTGYETLIYDCMIGDATLFQRADNIEAGWAIVQPLLESWQRTRPGRVYPYRAGSQGPSEVDDLMAHDGRHWLRLD